MKGLVRTVLGDVAPGNLGATYCHEQPITRSAAQFGDDLRLDDEDRAADELDRFRGAGGTVVEVTTPGFGRDVAALRRLAARTGVRIVDEQTVRSFYVENPARSLSWR